MYPLFEDTACWAEILDQKMDGATARDKAMCCLVAKPDLEGVSYIEDLPAWQHLGKLAYKTNVPKNDILEAIYVVPNQKNASIRLIPHPVSQLAYPTGTQTIPLPQDGVFELPTIALQFISDIELHIELNPDTAELPCVKVRSALLNKSKYREVRDGNHKWKEYRISGGLLHDEANGEEYYENVYRPVTELEFLVKVAPIVTAAMSI